jgi:hypothetical protein
VLDENF